MRRWSLELVMIMLGGDNNWATIATFSRGTASCWRPPWRAPPPWGIIKVKDNQSLLVHFESMISTHLNLILDPSGGGTSATSIFLEEHWCKISLISIQTTGATKTTTLTLAAMAAASRIFHRWEPGWGCEDEMMMLFVTNNRDNDRIIKLNWNLWTALRSRSSKQFSFTEGSSVLRAIGKPLSGKRGKRSKICDPHSS